MLSKCSTLFNTMCRFTKLSMIPSSEDSKESKLKGGLSSELIKGLSVTIYHRKESTICKENWFPIDELRTTDPLKDLLRGWRTGHHTVVSLVKCYSDFSAAVVFNLQFFCFNFPENHKICMDEFQIHKKLEDIRTRYAF